MAAVFAADFEVLQADTHTIEFPAPVTACVSAFTAFRRFPTMWAIQRTNPYLVPDPPFDVCPDLIQNFVKR